MGKQNHPSTKKKNVTDTAVEAKSPNDSHYSLDLHEGVTDNRPLLLRQGKDVELPSFWLLAAAPIVVVLL